MAVCYGQSNCETLSTPNLCSLPPTCTTEAFVELDPEKYEWNRDEPNTSLVPVTVPEEVPLYLWICPMLYYWHIHVLVGYSMYYMYCRLCYIKVNARQM